MTTVDCVDWLEMLPGETVLYCNTAIPRPMRWLGFLPGAEMHRVQMLQVSVDDHEQLSRSLPAAAFAVQDESTHRPTRWSLTPGNSLVVEDPGSEPRPPAWSSLWASNRIVLRFVLLNSRQLYDAVRVEVRTRWELKS